MPSKQKYQTIRLILGDQINPQHSWFNEVDHEILYVFMEIRPESEYVRHHIQKITGIFQAMRSFNDQLKNDGHHVLYLSITDENNKHSFKDNLSWITEQFHVQEATYQACDEYRLDRLLDQAFQDLGIPFEMVDSEHFLTSRHELADFFDGKKQFLMESFYRHMRKEHRVLMQDEKQPAGGTWNYDKENRNKLPANASVPEPFTFNHDVSKVVADIREAGLDSIGNIDETSFIWPINRAESLEILSYFADQLLPDFGTYQDALSDDHWSLYHSRLSFALNLKMLSPREVIQAVEDKWKANENHADIAQVEGFIRQILGWREYMRGIYWAHMPEYAKENFFGNDRSLPQYFWTGETKMRCIQKAVSQSLDHAYAHHIQRLMITGNFCALTGIDPDEVDQWYLGIYIDAFDWVEITNTRGMSQYADGGLVATKPYVSSASYINKMGDHCKSCHYKHTLKTGDKACPFNSLYWHFLARNRDQLDNNPRMGMMYRVWEKMDNGKQQELLDQADHYLENLESL